MTDEQSPPEPSFTAADAPFPSKAGGTLKALLTIGAALYGFMTGKLGNLGDGRSAEYQYEDLEQRRIKMLQQMREIERQEEEHTARMRFWDAELQRSLVTSRFFEDQGDAQKAEKRRNEAQERYWKAKLELLAKGDEHS